MRPSSTAPGARKPFKSEASLFSSRTSASCRLSCGGMRTNSRNSRKAMPRVMRANVHMLIHVPDARRGFAETMATSTPAPT